MHAIPMTLAQWQSPSDAGTYSVYRTSQGRIAVRRGDESEDLVVVDSVDHLAPHVPAELVSLVEQRLAGAT